MVLLLKKSNLQKRVGEFILILQALLQSPKRGKLYEDIIKLFGYLFHFGLCI